MPVEIITATRSGPEFEAATTLQRWFREFTAPEDQVTIIVGAKTEGEQVEDIDLIVIGKLGRGRFLPEGSLPDSLRGQRVELRDFLFTIEVKMHDPSAVRLVIGNKVQVRYQGKWKSATDQANLQKYSLKNWVEKTLRIVCPRISHAVWLMNVPSDAMPRRPRHVLFSDSGLSDLFALMDAGVLERAALEGEAAKAVTSVVGRDRSTIAQLQAYFQDKVRLGAIDRRKLERICERIVRDQNWTGRLGQQLLVFRGRGGAGKTLRLLNLARYLHQERGQRVLFLTYNRALVQDVRRLIHVLGLAEKDVRIQTSDSYLLKLCEALNLAPQRENGRLDWKDFGAKKAEAARRLEGMAAEEIEQLRAAPHDRDIFNWDTVLVDEGQDWPPADKAAIFSIFGHRRVIVADGVDQFVQSVEHCDWTSGVPTAERQIVSLPKSLRLKANLCRFAMAFAAEMQLPDWNIDLDPDLSGGRVQILLRPYTRDDHERIFREHEKAGNHPIDALFCLSKARGSLHHDLPDTLRSWGRRVWDGTVSDNRGDYPRDLNQFRVVQYQSCRGLEGWTVVCLDLDRLYEEQLKYAPASADLFVDQQAAARRYATRWCLIPFTRAIDTLVIHVSEHGELGQNLLDVAARYPDFVDVIR